MSEGSKYKNVSQEFLKYPDINLLNYLCYNDFWDIANLTKEKFDLELLRFNLEKPIFECVLYIEKLFGNEEARPYWNEDVADLPSLPPILDSITVYRGLRLSNLSEFRDINSMYIFASIQKNEALQYSEYSAEDSDEKTKSYGCLLIITIPAGSVILPLYLLRTCHMSVLLDRNCKLDVSLIDESQTPVHIYCTYRQKNSIPIESLYNYETHLNELIERSRTEYLSPEFHNELQTLIQNLERTNKRDIYNKALLFRIDIINRRKI